MVGNRSAGLVALLIACIPSAIATAFAQDPIPARVMVILDGSSGMWGRIGGEKEIPLVRNALKGVLASHKDRVAFGFAAFGHGSGSGCADWQVRAKPGEFTRATQNKILLNFRPRKQRPVATALTEAAKAAEGGNLDLLLITDGPDTCEADVCAVSKTLKDANPGLRISVIGFDKEPSESVKALSCAADLTGGRFTKATSADELKQGLSDILDVAASTPAAPAPAGAVVAANPDPAALVGTAPAEMAEVPESITSGEAPPAAEGEGEIPEPTKVPTVSIAPPPIASSESVQAKSAAEPNAPQDPAAAPAEGAPPQEMAAAPIGPAPAEAAPSADTGNPSLPVPVTFKAVLTEAGPEVANGVTWRIFSAKAGQNGKRQLIATRPEATATEALLPGEYLVNAAYGLSNLTKQINVHSGKSLEETFILNCGGLKLASMLVTGQALPDRMVRFDILSDEEDQFGNRRGILSEAKPGVVIRLNAGAYHIVSTYGQTNATVRADVTVEPGKITEATIKHAASPVTFKLVQNSGGEALAETKWRIFTPTGDVVSEVAGALPTHILAAGDYAVVANHNGESYTSKFSVFPGQPKQIEVVMDQGPTSPEALQLIMNPPDLPSPGEAPTGSPDTGIAFGSGSDGATPPPGPGGLINPGVLLRPRLP
jgi:hypothetical protein